MQPKVLRLLLHLITHRDRAVTSDELLRALWPNTKVEPGSLKRAVLGARFALGERGAEHSSVRTLRGHGYQFARPLHRRRRRAGVLAVRASLSRSDAATRSRADSRADRPRGPDTARAMHDPQELFADHHDADPLAMHSAGFRMFDSVGLFLRRAAERRPVVLGFDDLHLADAATLQLLTFIVRQAYAAPLFILGTRAGAGAGRVRAGRSKCDTHPVADVSRDGRIYLCARPRALGTT